MRSNHSRGVPSFSSSPSPPSSSPSLCRVRPAVWMVCGAALALIGLTLSTSLSPGTALSSLFGSPLAPPSPSFAIGLSDGDEGAPPRPAKTTRGAATNGMGTNGIAGSQRASTRITGGGTTTAAAHTPLDVIFTTFYDNHWVESVQAQVEVPAGDGRADTAAGRRGAGIRPDRCASSSGPPGQRRARSDPSSSSSTTTTTASGKKRRSFYHGVRKVPSLEWMVVFLRSAAAFAATRTATAASTRTIVTPVRVVFFVDAYTWARLRPLVADLDAATTTQCSGEGAAPNQQGGVVGCAPPRRPLVVEFVLVAFPRDRKVLEAFLAAHHSNSNSSSRGEAAIGGDGAVPLPPLQAAGGGALPPVVVAPLYLQEDWAAAIPNGANNFRFALYRDWLRSHSSGSSSRGSAGGGGGGGDASAPVNRRGSDRDNKDDLAGGLRGLRVLMCDATDVAFQADPFEARGCGLQGRTPTPLQQGNEYKEGEAPVVRGRVVGTLESERKGFHNEKYNRRWLSCLGHGALARLAAARAPVSCAGVTLADGTGAWGYLTAQLRLVSRDDLVTCALCTVDAALDQATHNYLLHGGHEGYKGKDGGNGPTPSHRGGIRYQGVLHSGVGGSGGGEQTPSQLWGNNTTFTAAASVDRDAIGGTRTDVFFTPHDDGTCVFHGNFGSLRMDRTDGTARNRRGELYAIVHQYSSDRHPPLMEALRRRFH